MDRITHVRIRNVRAIEAVDLELGRPLTVLIGENGAGKSTILECLEILRKSTDSRFIELLYSVHRGMAGLLRRGAADLTLGVAVEDDSGVEPRLDYELNLRQEGVGIVIEHERLRVANPDGQSFDSVLRDMSGAKIRETSGRDVQLAMSSVGLDRTVVFSASGLHGRDPSLTRLHAALSRIEVHLGFDSTAAWAARTLQRPETLRGPTTLFPAERVALLGVNLANAWAELLNRSTAHRDETMATVRLGLGDHVDSVVVVPDRGGGNVYLGLRLKDFEDPILAVNLSDGQLAWLAFIAMARLNDNRSLLAVDEPELHLHPALLGRVVSMLANLLGGAPVVLSTHSDRVLEMLDDPADAVRVCSLEGSRANMSRIDASELPRWMKEFGDVGQLRAAGYLARVLVPILPAASDDEGAE
jgi:predicted ATPase